MNQFLENKKELFIELASILNAKGANLSMEMGYNSQNDEWVCSNMPEVGGYNGPEGEGFYFKASLSHFGISESEIQKTFPINIGDYTFTMVSFTDYEIDFDDDRSWDESVAFIVEKEEKNAIQ